MDFELDDDLTSVQDLASQLFRQLAPVDRVVEVEKNEGGFDAKLWSALADAGLLGIAVPEESGGAGMGLLGLITVLEQQGRHVAPVPLWSVTAAASAIVRFGTAEQVERLVPGIVDGSRPVVAAFDAPYGELTSLSAVSKGDDLVVSGTVAGVPAAAVAAATIVPVRCDDGSLAVAVIPTGATGSRWNRSPQPTAAASPTSGSTTSWCPRPIACRATARRRSPGCAAGSSSRSPRCSWACAGRR